MNKFEMQDYLRDRFYEIIESYFVMIEDVICEKGKDLDDISKFADDIRFYKAWRELGNFKVSIFLEEVDDNREETQI